MRNQVIGLTLAGILWTPVAAFAQGGTSAEIAALRAQIAALSERLDRIERGQGSAPASASTSSQAAPAPNAPTVNVAAATAADAKPPPIRFSGDFRYRHETVNDDAFDERAGLCAEPATARPM